MDVSVWEEDEIPRTRGDPYEGIARHRPRVQAVSLAERLVPGPVLPLIDGQVPALLRHVKDDVNTKLGGQGAHGKLRRLITGVVRVKPNTTDLRVLARDRDFDLVFRGVLEMRRAPW